MKSKKSTQPPRPEFVTLDELQKWLSCRLCWKLSQEQPPEVEPPPWEHLQKCVTDSVLFYHHERTRRQRVYYPLVQEYFWDAFERQSLAVSQSYLPGTRARDLRAGEQVLEQYMTAASMQGPECLGTSGTWLAEVPGAKLPLLVGADLVYPGPKLAVVWVVQTVPDPELAQFQLAPWAGAVSLAYRAQHGREPKELEAVYLVANEPTQVVRLAIPPPPPETIDKLRLWLTAYACGLAQGEVFPQPGSHCAPCPYREPCAHWPAFPK